MAQNPLLGNRISLISKKNIRYEGVLYSINESDSTLALQNVKSYGTEGREKLEGTEFIGTQEGIHAYLLFRGCDIKDLHVHEQQQQHETTSAATEVEKNESNAVKNGSATTSPQTKDTTHPKDSAQKEIIPPPSVPAKKSSNTSSLGTKKEEKSLTAGTIENNNNNTATMTNHSNNNPQKRSSNTRRNTPAVGTGASLLNRKARGKTGGPGPEKPEGEFDIQAKLSEFDKGNDNPEQLTKDDEDNVDDDDDEAGAKMAHHSSIDGSSSSSHYEKDDFFDSISCNALDKKSGVDNRLRGKEERTLNTETFGATALNSQRKRRNGRGYYGGRGGGGRGRGGRGRGRGRGRGGGRYWNNNNHNNSNRYNNTQAASAFP